MARTGQNFSLYAGNSKMIYVNLSDKTGKAVKLEGATLKWVMKQRGRTLASKTLGNGISVTDNEKGRVLVKILPEDTTGLVGDCEHELQLTDGDGNVSTVTTGLVHIVASLVN